MQIRPIDVVKIKTWMREKAFLYALCLDRSISLKNQGVNEGVEKASIACVKEGVKIADQVQRRAWGEWLPKEMPIYRRDSDVDICFLTSKVHRVPTFEFIKDETDPIDSVLSYFKFKDCALEVLDPMQRRDLFSKKGTEQRR